MSFTFAGAAAGTAVGTLCYVAPLAVAAVSALAAPRARGVYIEPDPERPGYDRYVVLAHTGRVLAAGVIQHDAADDELAVLLQRFLQRRDPAPVAAPVAARSTARPHLALVRA